MNEGTISLKVTGENLISGENMHCRGEKDLRMDETNEFIKFPT